MCLRGGADLAGERVGQSRARFPHHQRGSRGSDSRDCSRTLPRIRGWKPAPATRGACCAGHPRSGVDERCGRQQNSAPRAGRACGATYHACSTQLPVGKSAVRTDPIGSVHPAQRKSVVTCDAARLMRLQAPFRSGGPSSQNQARLTLGSGGRPARERPVPQRRSWPGVWYHLRSERVTTTHAIV